MVAYWALGYLGRLGFIAFADGGLNEGLFNAARELPCVAFDGRLVSSIEI
jgi:hypothetical protein